MGKYLAILFNTFMLSFVTVSEPTEPAQGDSAWGYIDRNGVVVIQPQYDHAQPFSDGLACVRIGERFVFIDRVGNVVIETDHTPAGYSPEYDWPTPFSYGLAAIRSPDGSMGYINRQGNWAIQPAFAHAGRFNEGLAVASKYDSSLAEEIYGVIDTTGVFVINPDYELILEYSDGLALAFSSKTGYIDRTGRLLIRSPGSHTFRERFSDGLLVYEGFYEEDQWGDPGPRYGYMDTTWTVIIEARFAGAEPFSEGLAAVYLPYNPEEGLRIGYIDTKGEYVIEPEYIGAGPLTEGLAAVQVKETDLWGFINKSGEMVLPAIYLDAGKFSEGLAPVRIQTSK